MELDLQPILCRRPGPRKRPPLPLVDGAYFRCCLSRHFFRPPSPLPSPFVPSPHRRGGKRCWARSWCLERYLVHLTSWVVPASHGLAAALAVHGILSLSIFLLLFW